MKSLDRAMRILDLFTEADPEWSLTELSRAADLPLSTTHRIVSALVEYGLLTRGPETKEYRLGFRVVDLGYRALAGLDIVAASKAAMRGIQQQTQETVLLTVPNDARDCAVCVARVDGDHDLRIHLEVGSLVPLHAGASAQALLAHFSPEEVDEYIDRVGLPEVAPNTIACPHELRNRLAVIRRQGYAYSREETNRGAWGIAVPILGPGDEAVASLGVSAPLSRFSPEYKKRYIDLVRSATCSIAAAVGLRP